jgi:hypothetical protein
MMQSIIIIIIIIQSKKKKIRPTESNARGKSNRLWVWWRYIKRRKRREKIQVNKIATWAHDTEECRREEANPSEKEMQEGFFLSFSSPI